MGDDKKSVEDKKQQNRLLGCLVSPFSTVAHRVAWFIGFVVLLALSKGLEPHVNVIMHYQVPIETKVAQTQLVWPDFLGDHRVPALYKLIFGRSHDGELTVTPPHNETLAFTPTRAPTVMPASATPYIITATPAPPSATPVIITATPYPANEVGAAAESKESAPASPTDVPTQMPTDVPTQRPTDAPTQRPTDVPTRMPTDVPTQRPTDAPTQRPTDVPTQRPTDVPTQKPTSVPTQMPTDVPTRMPTATITATPLPPCFGAPPPQLEQGQTAIQLGSQSIKLRRSAGTDSSEIARLQRHDRALVIGGPECAEGRYWYRIVLGSGQMGWAAEGGKDTGRYWLVRALDDETCDRPPRLAPGDISERQGNAASNMRHLPGSGNRVIGRIQGSQQVVVRAGPVCADGYIWYNVFSEDLSLRGWVAEGGEVGYFFSVAKN